MRLLLSLLIIITIGSFANAQPLQNPDAKARCEVCGMFVAPYPNWLAVLEADDGRHFYFDGPKDLFICFRDLSHYLPGVNLQTVKLFVTEYYTTRIVPATEVFFITGSDVLGPMGQELVPVAGRATAETFRLDHAGAKLLRFDGHELIDVTESR